jgi:glycosyltransferase involved in cell wall biosynthesis
MVFASAVGQQDRPDEVHGGVLYSFVPHWGARFTQRARSLWRDRSPRRPFFASTINQLGYWVGVALRARRARADVIWIINYSQAVPIVRRLNPGATIVLNMRCEWLSQLDPRMVEKRLARLDLVVGCSDAVRNKVRARFPRFADRCATVHNGVDVEQFASLPLVRDGNDQEVRILSVGRISPEKGLHVLFEAFSHLWRRDSRVTLTVVGPDSVVPREMLVDLADDEDTRALRRFYSGDYSQMLRDSLDPDVAAHIKLVGQVFHEKLAEYYRSADVFVFPSIWDEPFGIPVIEAMAAGLPVVATRVGGVVETVEDGKTGFLVPPGDSQALAGAISSLLEDRALRERLGAAGRERALELFSFDSVAAAYENRMRIASATSEVTGRSAGRTPS